MNKKPHPFLIGDNIEIQVVKMLVNNYFKKFSWFKTSLEGQHRFPWENNSNKVIINLEILIILFYRTNGPILTKLGNQTVQEKQKYEI